MKNQELILAIKELYEKFILKEPQSFCLDDYNNFEAKIWELKDIYEYDNPFDLLPDPFSEAGLETMNASGDGLIEPSFEEKKKYLDKMKISYEKLVSVLRETGC